MHTHTRKMTNWLIQVLFNLILLNKLVQKHGKKVPPYMGRLLTRDTTAYGTVGDFTKSHSLTVSWCTQRCKSQVRMGPCVRSRCVGREEMLIHFLWVFRGCSTPYRRWSLVYSIGSSVAGLLAQKQTGWLIGSLTSQRAPWVGPGWWPLSAAWVQCGP